jgi:hypothetical protein
LQDWVLQPDQPCSGERLLLMFDRWQKLAKTFCKKGRFDISKVGESNANITWFELHINSWSADSRGRQQRTEVRENTADV